MCRSREATDDSMTERMRFAFQITKSTDTHSEYVTLLAFPRQQLLRECASMLRYSTLPLLVNFVLNSSLAFVCKIRVVLRNTYDCIY
jgi:hypothetical protein